MIVTENLTKVEVPVSDEGGCRKTNDGFADQRILGEPVCHVLIRSVGISKEIPLTSADKRARALFATERKTAEDALLDRGLDVDRWLATLEDRWTWVRIGEEGIGGEERVRLFRVRAF